MGGGWGGEGRRTLGGGEQGNGDGYDGDGAINFKNSYKTGSSRRSNNNNTKNKDQQEQLKCSVHRGEQGAERREQGAGCRGQGHSPQWTAKILTTF